MSKLKNILGVSASLAKAGFKLRNEGSYIGIFWYLLEPLLMFVIILSLLNTLNVTIEKYPIYLLLGLIMFNFFASSTSQAITMLSSKAKFIKSMKIPHEALVISGMLQTTLGVFISDMNNVWRVLTRLLWFTTPIFYAVRESTLLSKIVSLNPVYYIISIGRDFVIYGKFNIEFTLVSIIIGIISLAIGLWIFEKHKNKFAEAI